MSTCYDDDAGGISTAGKYKADTAVITLRLTAELKEQVRRGAASRSMSMTDFIRLAIRQMVSAPLEPDLSRGNGGFDGYFKNIRRSAEEHSRAMARRRAAAQAVFKEVAAMLTERFGVQSVRLVGSMGRPGLRITEASDIDMLVTGLRREDYVSALSAAAQVTKGEFTVDLIRREDLTDEAYTVFFDEGAGLQ